MVVICEKFGWDYYTYLSQPNWFLELAKIKYKLDGERIEKEIRKSNSKYYG